MSETYQGYKNHATWCVCLWLHNEEPTYRYWREQAAHFRESAPRCQQVEEGTWTIDEAILFNLADCLKEELTDAMPLQDEASLWSDLLSSYLQDVDWNEVATSFLGE